MDWSDQITSDRISSVAFELFISPTCAQNCIIQREVGLALTMLEKLPQRWGNHGLHLEVARAAKKQYPRESIRIVEHEAERFINDRNRGSYSQVALCLREIRDIYRQLNETESWGKLIMDIRDRHKRLPALQDELNQLKL